MFHQIHSLQDLMKPITKGKFEMLKESLGLVVNNFIAKRECQSFFPMLLKPYPPSTEVHLQQVLVPLDSYAHECGYWHRNVGVGTLIKTKRNGYREN